MHGEDTNQWASLIIERGAAPLALDDASFREWMAGRPVFVSSVMDHEMSPDRAAVRGWLERMGAKPVMWETLAPRDERADRAYLEGVDRAYALVMLAGSSYGVADTTGFSPTHKELNRAAEGRKPRLLLTRADVEDSARDGKLNRMLRELYHEISAVSYAGAVGLEDSLERHFRELAAREESLWLKLGPLVFPGQVQQRRNGASMLYTINARVRDTAVRRALSDLGGLHNRIRADRLSWLSESRPVAVDSVETSTARASESIVSVICRETEDRRGNGFSGMNMSIGGAGGRSFGPADQAIEWARRAVFGTSEADEGRGGNADIFRLFTSHAGPTLPEFLKGLGADAWLAEGLTRLFLVENLTHRFGGHFDHLVVGPSTASGVRIHALFSPAGGYGVAEISGVVPRS